MNKTKTTRKIRNKHTSNPKYKILAALMAIFLVISIFIASMYAAIYLDDGLFKREFEKYNVQNNIDMQQDEMLRVMDELMEYLIGRKDSIEDTKAIVAGEEIDFFNEKVEFHMMEVRNLFTGGVRIGMISFFLFSLLFVYLAAKNQSSLIASSIIKVIASVFIMVVTLAILIASNFSRAFTLFHEIFFNNDLWIFDPSEDIVINILPQGLFADIALSISLLFTFLCAIIMIICLIYRRKK